MSVPPPVDPVVPAELSTRAEVAAADSAAPVVSDGLRERALQLLREHWGYDRFRPHQQDIVAAIAGGRDVFALMPTGAGKSLCYQLPAVLQDGATVVISPLIALMKDQVDAALANGIRAACLHSGMDAGARREGMQAYRSGNLDLLYMAPERVALEGFLDQLRHCPTGRPGFIAIDEAHCISEWGHDFRSDYLTLGRLREAFPESAVAAFTATATERVAEDIVARLGLRDPFRVRASFNRPNLHYAVLPKHDAEQQIIEFVQAHAGQAGIIYRSTRRHVEATAAALRSAGVNARGYHAGMEGEDRSRHQEAFIRGEVDVIVATIAFGMGIDKPDVRYVVHGDLPKNIEAYYQETGRAGRDGDPSRCLLLFSGADTGLHLHFLKEIEDDTERAAAHERLRNMERYAQGFDCRRRVLLGYFGEAIKKEQCEGCDVCDSDLEEVDATRDARMLLSAIARTGERFGMVHVCDIVGGAATARIRQFGHDQLPTYGVGRDKPKAHWREVGDALLASGILRRDDGGMPVIKFGAGARELLKGQDKFVIRRLPRHARAERPRRGDREVEVVHPALFEELRRLRRQLADRDSVPPYVVASDRMLRDLCAKLPSGTVALARVYGFGTRKVEQYGGDFLGVVNEFRRQHPEAAPVPSAAGAAARPAGSGDPSRPRLSAPMRRTLEGLRQGWDLDRIAADQGNQPATIVDHIDRLSAAGESPPVEHLMDERLLAVLRPLFVEHGFARLKPVVEAAAEQGLSVSYDQARLVRALLVQRDRAGSHENES